MLLFFTGILCFVICCKFFAAIRCQLQVEPELYDRYVVINVPVYSEGADSILATLQSIVATRYPDERKLLFIVCDGQVTGSGNDMPTPDILLDALEIDTSIVPMELDYESLGEGKDMVNRARVYSGVYAVNGQSIQYIVVIKIGREGEVIKAGNRGKRDSQLVLLRMLSRAHYDQPMNPLEIEILHHMIDGFGMVPGDFEFVLMIVSYVLIVGCRYNGLSGSLKPPCSIYGS